MAFELKDGQGSLFRNNRKEQESHPDHTGTIKVAGVEYWLNGWVRETKNGQKYFSLSVKPKQARTLADPPPPSQERQTDPFNDEVPF
jgi:hypothetical protein